MDKPKIIRKRYIPNETVDISGDTLLFRDDEVVITKWKAIRRRADISWGVSYTFLKRGYKVSRFYGPSGEFLYWYCDIVDVHYDEADDRYLIVDLLLDVKIMPDGRIIVLDADELSEALEKGLVSPEQAARSLKNFDKILKMAYGGAFPPDICRDTKYWDK